MVASNYDRRLQFASRDQIIKRQPKLVALTITQPADSRRQSLKFHPLLRQLDPAREDFVVWKHFQHELIRAMDIRRLSRKRRPAKRPAPFAEERPNICRNEAGEIVSVLNALLISKRPNVIAVIERYGAKFLQRQHSLHMPRHRFERTPAVSLPVALPQFRRLRHIKALWNIAADRIVRARLIGE